MSSSPHEVVDCKESGKETEMTLADQGFGKSLLHTHQECFYGDAGQLERLKYNIKTLLNFEFFFSKLLLIDYFSKTG